MLNLDSFGSSLSPLRLWKQPVSVLFLCSLWEGRNNYNEIAFLCRLRRELQQFFRPYMSVLQRHLMGKGCQYLVAVTKQLYSGLNFQNYNIPPELFRNFHSHGGHRSNIIPESHWHYLFFNYPWIRKINLHDFFLSHLKTTVSITYSFSEWLLVSCHK